MARNSLLCGVCGSSEEYSATSLYWHLRRQHKYDHDEAFAFVGNAMVNDNYHTQGKGYKPKNKGEQAAYDARHDRMKQLQNPPYPKKWH